MNERIGGILPPEAKIEDTDQILRANLEDLLSERMPVEQISGNLFINDDKLGDVIAGVNQNEVVCSQPRIGIIVGTGGGVVLSARNTGRRHSWYRQRSCDWSMAEFFSKRTFRSNNRSGL